MYEYRCVIKKVIDGDTVDVDIDLGFDVWLNNQRVRFAGIDAPETRTRDLAEKERGLESRAFVMTKLIVGEKYTLRSYKDDRGKYGRVIGDFIVEDCGEEVMLTELMLEKGLAEVYGE